MRDFLEIYNEHYTSKQNGKPITEAKESEFIDEKATIDWINISKKLSLSELADLMVKFASTTINEKEVKKMKYLGIYIDPEDVITKQAVLIAKYNLKSKNDEIDGNWGVIFNGAVIMSVDKMS